MAAIADAVRIVLAVIPSAPHAAVEFFRPLRHCVVMSRMVHAVREFKILDAIIGSISVDVMDDLICSQFSSDGAFHYKAMLKDAPTVRQNKKHVPVKRESTALYVAARPFLPTESGAFMRAASPLVATISKLKSLVTLRARSTFQFLSQAHSATTIRTEHPFMLSILVPKECGSALSANVRMHTVFII